GGGGTDTLALDTDQGADWRLDGNGAGQVSGPLPINFTGVEQLVGGAAADTLHGSAADTDWLIDGVGSGSVGTYRFSNVEQLIGAADNNDTFTITSKGRLAGGVDGGAGGFDSLVLDTGVVENVISAATAPDAGTITYDSATLSYRGLEPVTLSGTQ